MIAGWVAIIKLPTLTYNEVQNFDPSVKFEDFMIEGSYPRIYNLNINHTQFYLNYIETYIARHVKDQLDVKHLREFKEVMVALAGRSGQHSNYSELSKFVQVDQRTIKSWINILCSSYICFMLPPYFSNINKRLFKSPKLYFFDTGLLCHLLNIENSSEYYQSEFKGHIFENFVVSEVVKSYYNNNRDTRLYFYRDDNNTEVDLLNLSKDSKFKICEIKSSRLYKEKFTKNLRKVSSYLNIPKENTCVIYPDDFSWKDCGIQILSVQSYLDSLN